MDYQLTWGWDPWGQDFHTYAIDWAPDAITCERGGGQKALNLAFPSTLRRPAARVLGPLTELGGRAGEEPRSLAAGLPLAASMCYSPGSMRGNAR